MVRLLMRIFGIHSSHQPDGRNRLRRLRSTITSGITYCVSVSANLRPGLGSR